MNIKRTSNIQHSTSNIECGIQTAANSFGVRCSMLNVGCFGVSRHPSPARGVGNPNSKLRTPNSQSGMALVITLILLSVTLVMAVAFLAISRRERNAVTTTTDTATARLAADAALANAEAQIVASIFATTNAAAYNFGLLVSTNYINRYGFV